MARRGNPLAPWAQTPLHLRTVAGPDLYPLTLADATVSGDTTVASCVVPAGSWQDGEIVVVRLLALLKNDSGSSRNTTIKANATGGSAASLETNSLGASATEFGVFGTVPFIRGGSTLYIPARALNATAVAGISGSNMTPSARELVTGAQAFDGGTLGTVVPTSFDADITLTVIINLAVTNAGYYFKPKSGAAYKTREFVI